jgi:predicted permease
MILGEWWRRAWYAVNRRRFERALEEELAAHREMMRDPRRFGNVTRIREESRDVWRPAWLAHVSYDVRHAVRVLSRLPGFSVTATLILAVGIGLNLTFFHLLNVTVLQPLPVREPATLVRLHRAAKTFTSNGMPYPATQFFRDNPALAAVLVQMREDVVWEGDVSERTEASYVSANWFEELGYPGPPTLGRVFDREIDERPDAAAVIVVSHEFWRTRLGSSPRAAGMTVRVNERPATIVGVAPEGFPGTELENPRMWILIHQMDYFNPGTTFKENWAENNTEFYARLRPGMSEAATVDALRPAIAELARRRPRDFQPDQWFLTASANDRFLVPREQREIWTAVSLVGGLTLLVLIVASANLGNLVLSHAIGRLREFTVRSALGASRMRIASHLLVETLLLALMGACGGLAIGQAGALTLASITELPGYLDFGPDWRLFAAASSAAVLAMLAFGLIPAWMVSRRDLSAGVKDGGQQASTGLSRTRFRLVSIACQVAGCCALMVVAAAITRGLQRATTADVGFTFENVAVLDPSLWRNGIRGEAGRAYWSEVRRTLEARPDVDRVALVSFAPLGGSVSSTKYNDTPGLQTTVLNVEPAFFSLMDIPILAGRSFGPGDRQDTVVVISRRVAEAMYGTPDAVGRGFPRSRPSRVIVGIAGDAHLIEIRATDVAEEYRPLSATGYDRLVMMVRTRGNPELLLKPMWEAARAADPRVLPTMRLLRADFDQHLRAPRLASLLGALTALLALTLACVGIFALVSYAVTLRTKEIGIRRALGANASHVVALIARQLLLPVAFGMLVGTAAGMFAISALQGEPFYLASSGPSGPATALLIFALTAGSATIYPAQRALGGDPLHALRHD